MYPNIQAYDRGAMFSPDGRLFQVDYAREAVRKGATSIGLIADDAVALVAHKNITEPLAIPATVQKIFKIDANIGATYSGLVSDGLHLINIMRHKTQSHRMLYDETESVETVARDLAEEMQVFTQYAGMRPYAISLLLGGFDKIPKLFEIDAGASFLGYKADAIGAGKQAAQELILKEYKEGMAVDDALHLAIGVMKKVAGKLTQDSLDVAVISKKMGFKQYTPDDIAKLL